MSPDATVFVIDDDTAVRESLTLLLELEELKVKTFESAEAFLAASPSVLRSCAIVDIRMTGISGMQLQAELLRRRIRLPIIFLTGYGDIPQSVLAIKSGAIDFLTKPIKGASLIKSVHAALLESDRMNLLAEANDTASTRLARLTEREHEVLLLVVEGLSNKLIARQLGISHRTVEIHKARVMQKTGTETVIDLARIAGARGVRS